MISYPFSHFTLAVGQKTEAMSQELNSTIR